jgi:hypothetical protein
VTYFELQNTNCLQGFIEPVKRVSEPRFELGTAEITNTTGVLTAKGMGEIRRQRKQALRLLNNPHNCQIYGNLTPSITKHAQTTRPIETTVY